MVNLSIDCSDPMQEAARDDIFLTIFSDQQLHPVRCFFVGVVESASLAPSLQLLRSRLRSLQLSQGLHHVQQVFQVSSAL
jgi:hypothetical protein